ncbi:MAG: 4-hydroxythreonine-4-phosphate dehydrogenase PdxA [Planctomycetota bacterium]
MPHAVASAASYAIQPSSRPVLAITCGDPAGIGPEVVLAAWAATKVHSRARLRVVADADMLAAVLADVPGLPAVDVVPVQPDDLRPSTVDAVLVIAPDRLIGPVPRGAISAAGGESAVAALEVAYALTRRGLAQAIVTGPLHKLALHMAGYTVPGHTEWLARACGLPDSAASMMLWLPPQAAHLVQAESQSAVATHGLGVVHATLHESLQHALAHLSVDGIVQAGLRLAALLTAILKRQPRIAVAALNPHGGESGLFGDEEARIIAPAVEQLTRAGLDVHGPIPADTLFMRASRGGFDGIVAQYHDQGHIPIKLLGMHRAVNITLGLPLVRTSVAHGTALDIVGTGSADPASMLAAIEVALDLVNA